MNVSLNELQQLVMDREAWRAAVQGQGIFPTQELNLGLLHCRQNLYYLSHQGNLTSTYRVC